MSHDRCHSIEATDTDRLSPERSAARRQRLSFLLAAIILFSMGRLVPVMGAVDSIPPPQSRGPGGQVEGSVLTPVSTPIPRTVASIPLSSPSPIPGPQGRAIGPTATASALTSIDAIVTVDRTKAVATSAFSVGVTHTQYTPDDWNDPIAVSGARQLLRTAVAYQNQHIMGWGANNPEPAPGVFDWATLDERVNLIRQSGGTPVLTLCGAPDWMKDPHWTANSPTDWDHLEWAPLPEHYGDFAVLAKQIALRYPDVHHFQVWNEMKGFYNPALNRWDYEHYTQLYNLVYDALKSVTPTIQVGGPYVVMDSWGCRSCMSNPSDVSGPYGTLDQRPLDVIGYWLAHKHGADFISVDGGTRNWDGVAVVDPFTASQKFVDVARWIKQRTNLPLWWSEWSNTPAYGDHNYQNATMAAALVKMITSGAANALRWQPQGIAGSSYQGDQESMWSDTRSAGGGKPFPFYYTQKALHDFFGPGTTLYQATSSGSVEVLASANKTLLINKRATTTTVSLDGATLTLAGYEVRIV